MASGNMSPWKSDCGGGAALLSAPARFNEATGQAPQYPPPEPVETAGNRPPRRGSRLTRSPTSQALAGHLTDMAAGNHAALAHCYDLLGPVVFSLAVRMLRDRQAAEDVTQDIFTQVWRQAANYNTERGSPEAWVMTIARSRVLDRLRSRRAGVVLKTVGENLPEAPAADDWPDDLAITREDAAKVRQALLTLPADQKLAIELAFFEGLTHVEIAQQTQAPLGTVKTRIRLGLLKIKDQME